MNAPESRAARRAADPQLQPVQQRGRVAGLLAAPRRVRVPDEADFTPTRRRTMAAVAAWAGVCGLVSVIPGLPAGVAGALALAFVAGGPGSLLLLALGRLPRLISIVAIPSLGMSVVSLLASAELAASTYHAKVTTLILGLLCAGAGFGAPRLFRRPRGHRTEHREPAGARLAALLREHPPYLPAATLAVVSMVLTLLSVPLVRNAPFSSYGLLGEVPTLGLAVAAAIGAFLLALRRGNQPIAWLASGSLILALRGQTLLATSAPVYSWTYQHLGVIDWFNHSGTLARDVDVYSNWPGALAFFAWFTESTGVSRFTLAHAFILGYHALTIVAVYALARSFRRSQAESLVATFLVEAVNWVGQDYLSPQAFAFLLALVVISLLLTGRDRHYRAPSSVGALIIFVAIAWSHQLTPIWVLVVAIALWCIGFARPTWMVAGMVLTVLVMIAVNWSSLSANFTGVSADIVANSAGNVSTPVAAGQEFTSAAVHVLAAVLWVSALGTGLWQLRRAGQIRRRETIALLVLAYSPMTMLLTNYGGEVVFRAYLYSLPGAAILLSPLLTRWVTGRLWPAVASTVTVMLLTSLAAQGSWGNWALGVIPRADMLLQLHLEKSAGEHGQIGYVVGGVLPGNATWRYVPRTRNNVIVDQLWGIENLYTGTDGKSSGPVDGLTYATFERMPASPMYVVISASMRRYAEQFGTMSPGAFARIERHFVADGWFLVYQDTAGTVVYATDAGRLAWPAGG